MKEEWILLEVDGEGILSGILPAAILPLKME